MRPWCSWFSGCGGWMVPLPNRGLCLLTEGRVGLLRGPLALPLRRLRQPPGDVPARASGRWTVSPLNVFFFVVALGADGVFTATLSTLVADLIPVTSALIGAG